MRIHDTEIYSFLLGAGLSWLVTYLVLTHERRTIASVRKQIIHLAAFHDLTPRQWSETFSGGNVSDKQCWQAYQMALESVKGTFWSGGRRYVRTIRAKGVAAELSPTVLAAEIILCDKVLGLLPIHAVRTLLRTKDYRDLKKNLDDVIAEIGNEFSN